MRQATGWGLTVFESLTLHFPMSSGRHASPTWVATSQTSLAHGSRQNMPQPGQIKLGVRQLSGEAWQLSWTGEGMEWGQGDRTGNWTLGAGRKNRAWHGIQNRHSPATSLPLLFLPLPLLSACCPCLDKQTIKHFYLYATLYLYTIPYTITHPYLLSFYNTALYIPI